MGEEGQERPRDHRNVRDQVAGFANAEGGVLVLGIEDDHRITGQPLQSMTLNGIDGLHFEVLTALDSLSLLDEHALADFTLVDKHSAGAVPVLSPLKNAARADDHASARPTIPKPWSEPFLPPRNGSNVVRESTADMAGKDANTEPLKGHRYIEFLAWCEDSQPTRLVVWRGSRAIDAFGGRHCGFGLMVGLND